MAEPPVSIVIGRLADGPCPPATAGAAWPNMLHTRVPDLVATLGPAPLKPYADGPPQAVTA